MSRSSLARIAALIVAMTIWVGLAVQFVASVGLAASAGAALWMMLLYFTILANLASALLFTAMVAGSSASARLIGGVTLAMLLVGIVYHLLLSGLLSLSGGAALADVLLHTVAPILVPSWWLVFAPKGGLTMRDPPIWAVFPLAYFVYGLARGGRGGHYPYPFMNLDKLGWGHTLLNACVIAIAFMLAGYALVGIDRLFARRA
jgi:hypothetical protein